MSSYQSLIPTTLKLTLNFSETLFQLANVRNFLAAVEFEINFICSAKTNNGCKFCKAE